MKNRRHRSDHDPLADALRWTEDLKNKDFKLTSLEFSKIIFDLKTIELGPVEEQFLSIISENPISASGISHILEDVSATEKRKYGSGMPYANIHKRIQRLKTLGLVDEEGKYSRNEIKYKITSRGLFQLMSDYGLTTYALLKHKDDVVLQTLLFQFFEMVTIQKFITYARVFALRNYLRNMTNSIVKKIEELQNIYAVDGSSVVAEIEGLIRREIEQFVFLIVVPWKIPVDYKDKNLMSFVNHQKVWFVRYGADLDEDENGPNYKNDLFPKAALMNDRKFLKILKQIKADFDTGCRDYLSSLG